jgi:hypothetical protein
VKTLGDVESLVLEAWGVGIRIDRDLPKLQAALVDLIDRARAMDGETKRLRNIVALQERALAGSSDGRRSE